MFWSISRRTLARALSTLALAAGLVVTLPFIAFDCFSFLFCLLVSQGGVDFLRDALCARVTVGVAIGEALLDDNDWRRERRVV